MKKNILGMDMTEWKHLSGLADPYRLALAEAGVEAGVPPVVESKTEDDEDDEDDDDPSGADAAQAQNKQARLIAIKRSMRSLRSKTRNAAEKAATTPAKDRYKTTLELAKHRKTFVKAEGMEDLDPEIMWAVYLEDIGSSAEEFGRLLDIAMESDDEDMAIELIAIEDQLDEILGAIGAGLAKGAQVVGRGAMAVGKTVAKGAMAAGKGIVKGAEAAGGAIKQGFKAGMGGDKPAAGGEPAAAPPAGAPPAATQSAPAAPAAAATAAAPATAPTGSAGAQTAGNANGGPAAAAGGAPAAPGAEKEPKKIGLLGTLGRGIGKVAKGVAGIGAAGVGAVGRLAGGVKAGMKGEDVEAWEEFIAEEFDMTAEQYVEMFDRAIEEDDQDILGNAHQIDEIFAAWRAKKAAAEQEKTAKGMAAVKAAVGVIKDRGAANVKRDAQHGRRTPETKTHSIGSEPKKGTGTTLNQSAETSDIADQIMESSGYAPKAKPATLKELMGDQLRFSGYTDEHLSKRG